MRESAASVGGPYDNPEPFLARFTRDRHTSANPGQVFVQPPGTLGRRSPARAITGGDADRRVGHRGRRPRARAGLPARRRRPPGGDQGPNCHRGRSGAPRRHRHPRPRPRGRQVQPCADRLGRSEHRPRSAGPSGRHQRVRRLRGPLPGHHRPPRSDRHLRRRPAPRPVALRDARVRRHQEPAVAAPGAVARGGQLRRRHGRAVRHLRDRLRRGATADPAHPGRRGPTRRPPTAAAARHRRPRHRYAEAAAGPPGQARAQGGGGALCR